jgi:hypothetical protein
MVIAAVYGGAQNTVLQCKRPAKMHYLVKDGNMHHQYDKHHYSQRPMDILF